MINSQIRLDNSNSVANNILSGLLSGAAVVVDFVLSIRVPESISRFVPNIPMPSVFNTRRSSFSRPRYQYAPVGQEDPAEVLMDDYENDNL